MHTTALSFAPFAAPLASLRRWFGQRTTVPLASVPLATGPLRGTRAHTGNPAAHRPHPVTSAPYPPCAGSRPRPRIHRTVRLWKPGSDGRLAIVGRMADVCAELDRLAAREMNG